MVSVIITAWKEPNTIGRAIRCVADQQYSGRPDDFEIIQVSPDQATLQAGAEAAQALDLGKRYSQIVDPQKGKPHALNLAFSQAKGTIWLLTDGDVYFDRMAVKHLLMPLQAIAVGGVSARPIPTNSRRTLYGYWWHLLTAAADYRRQDQRKSFFPLSGYGLAMRAQPALHIPVDMLVDDAYISYYLAQQGQQLAYAPKARVLVNYPTTLSDYYKQRKRTIGGFVQLQRSPIFKEFPTSRSFLIELGYSWFPLTYARNLKELCWSALLFPVRLTTWLFIAWERYVLRKDFAQTWVRVESTK